MSVPLDNQSCDKTSTDDTGGDRSPALTVAGRVFCATLAHRVFERASLPATPSMCEVWETAAPSAGLRWSVCSGSRLVGGLPAVDRTGTQLVTGAREYVIKLELGTEQVPVTRYGNCREALVWDQATERGVAHLFAPVVDHANDYHWLVMEEVTTVGHDSWGGHGSPPHAARPAIGPVEERFSDYDQALAEAGLEFGAGYHGQVGLDHCDHLVALDYEHLHDVTARTDPVWAGTYDPAHRTFISPTVARERNNRWRFRLLRWLADQW
jgi:hypothetical protein